MGIFKRAKRAEEGIIDADVLLTKLGDDNVTEQIALQIPAIASSVDWIASRIKSLPIKLYEERDGKTEEITDDYRLKLLNDENDYDTMTAAEMKEAMVRDYLLCGRAYAFIDWELNRVKALHYVRAGDVSYNLPLDPIYRSASYHIGGKEYRPYQLLRLLRHTRDGVSGKSILAESPMLISVAYKTLLFERKLVASGGCRKAYIKAEKPLAKPALEDLKEGWRKLWTLDGDAAITLNAGVDVKEAASSPTELQLNENKITNSGQIYEVLGLSSEIIRGTATDEQIAHAVESVIIPIVSDFQAILNRNLLLEDEKDRLYFAFDLKELLRGDIVKRYQAYKVALESNFMQLDEVRYAEDLPPLGFNYLRLGLNDVLFDAKTKTIYTPNMNAFAKLGGKTKFEGGEDNESGDKS